MVIRGIAQGRKGYTEGGKRQEEDAFDRGRRDGHACCSQAAVEQDLRDQPPEGMADDVWSFIQAADDLLVMLDDLGDSKGCDGGGVRRSSSISPSMPGQLRATT